VTCGVGEQVVPVLAGDEFGEEGVHARSFRWGWCSGARGAGNAIAGSHPHPRVTPGREDVVQDTLSAAWLVLGGLDGRS
jgi:hypothetical protein